MELLLTSRVHVNLKQLACVQCRQVPHLHVVALIQVLACVFLLHHRVVAVILVRHRVLRHQVEEVVQVHHQDHIPLLRRVVVRVLQVLQVVQVVEAVAEAVRLLVVEHVAEVVLVVSFN